MIQPEGEVASCRSCHGKGVTSPFEGPRVCTRCHGTGKIKLTIKDLFPQDHACFLYDDPKYQLDTAVTYIVEGLKQRECCFYIADEFGVDEIKEALAKNGVNVKKQIKNRALNILTKNETYLVNGHFDPSEMLYFVKDAVKAATRAGFMAFRGAGEMTWALGNEKGCDQLIPYEFLLDEYFANVRPDITALCQYNIKRFPASTIQSVLHTHKVVILADGKAVSNPYHQDNFHLKDDSVQLDSMIARLRNELLSN